MRGRRGEEGPAEVVIRESWESRCDTVTHALNFLQCRTLSRHCTRHTTIAS